MTSNWLRGVKLIGSAALINVAMLGVQAQAGTLLTEDFSGAQSGTYGTGPLPGTVFKVTTANVDVGGASGTFFSCVDNPGGNCLDLVGNQGAGGIASNSGFSLTAGNTYTIKFGALLQGYDPGMGFTSFAVGLGSLSQLESLTGTVQQFVVSFTPTVGQANAALSFTTVVAGDQVHGAVLDHISLTEAAPVSGTPEPASWALMFAGFGIVGGVMRRRAGVVSVAA